MAEKLKRRRTVAGRLTRDEQAGSRVFLVGGPAGRSGQIAERELGGGGAAVGCVRVVHQPGRQQQQNGQQPVRVVHAAA